MTFCLWGRGVELLIDSITLALNNQIRIFASLLADVAVRGHHADYLQLRISRRSCVTAGPGRREGSLAHNN
jgi:hypothetical protein